MATPAEGLGAREPHGLAEGPASSVPGARPALTTAFIGREQELREVLELLQGSTQRLITVVAPGGMGKSRFALEVAARWEARQASVASSAAASECCFVDLAPLGSPALLIPALARAAGCSLRPAEEPARQLRDSLAGRRLLLLLDNFEHLMPGAGLVSELLEACPELRILITSRERLGLHAETRYALTGLEVPPERLAADPSEFSAVQLFIDCARRVRREFRLSPEDAPHVVGLCQLLDGVPLGIVLAASWIGTLQPRELVEELARSMDFLRTAAPDVPERQRSLRAVFEHSWSLLDAERRGVLARASVFRGGFTRVAAKDIAGADLSVLGSLLDQALLQRAADGGRYDVHALVREYAASKLAEAHADHDHTLERHARFFAHFLHEREAALKGSEPQLAAREIEVELDNVRRAWSWLLENESWAELERAMEPLHSFYALKGRMLEAEQAFAAAAGALRARGRPRSEEQRRLAGRALSLQANCCCLLWRHREAVELATLALQHIRPEQSPRDAGQALLAWGMALCWSGCVLEGVELTEEALAAYRRHGDAWELALALALVGHRRIFIGPDKAKAYLEESIALQRSSGQRRIVLPGALRSLATLRCETGDYPAARRLALEALEICERQGNRWAERGTLQTLQSVERRAGCYGPAETYARRELELTSRLFPYMACVSHVNLAELLKELGRLDEALWHCERGEDTENEQARALALLQRADIAELQGDLDTARSLLAEGLAAFERLSSDLGIVAAANHLGLLAARDGAALEARQLFARALAHAVAMQHGPTVGNVLASIARLLATMGDCEHAAELLGLLGAHAATEHYTRARHLAPLARELEERLAPDVLHAALQRGQQLELQATGKALLERGLTGGARIATSWGAHESATEEVSASEQRAGSAAAEVATPELEASPAPGEVAPLDTTHEAPRTAPRAGPLKERELFAGRYLISRLVARGGMGTVFEAQQLSTERRVALKKLHPGTMESAQARRAFELEARVAARIQNEHIVQVLDAGHDPATRTAYLVMEWLDGRTLEALIAQQGSIPALHCIELLQQVAAGLDAAHAHVDATKGARPIIHRDLKPGNVFITQRRDGTPLVKILDFGIAKMAGVTRDLSQEVRGTPLYMAPEQLTLSELSPQTDVWALGLIAYQLLVGRSYWRSADPLRGTLPSLFAEIVSLPLAPPRERMAEQGLALQLPEAFDAWLLRCLEREPGQRFASAGQAVSSLSDALQV